MNDVYKLAPRARRRAVRREEILDAAQALLQSEGPEGLTIAKLAGALDYTVGAVYRYFPGKAAILADVELRLTRARTAHFGATLDASEAELASSRLTARRRSLLPFLALAECYG